MALSSNLIAAFVKATKEEKKVKAESTLYGTIVDYNGSNYVKLDGSDQLTPVTITTDVMPGERVTVLLKDHSAIVTGNLSSPAARTDTVKELGTQITEFEIVIADKISTSELEAERARIDSLVAEDVLIKNSLTASEALIDELTANNVEITGKLEAAEADIDNLSANKLDASVADLTYATIESLNATDAEIYNLNATYGQFVTTTTGRLDAIDAEIKNLDVGGLTAEEAEILFANIEFTNIGDAAIENLFVKSGIIKDLIMSDGVVTGELTGVKINGDLITAGTLVADKLIIQGEDGLYYRLNTDGVSITGQQTEYNSLNGAVILADSITANKIHVDDLYAFDATIGGFKITENSIYSGVKSSVNNTTRGSYLDDEGQFAIGDSANYLKYYKDTDGKYKLAILANSLRFGAGSTSVEEYVTQKVDDVQIGGRNLIRNSGFNSDLSYWSKTGKNEISISGGYSGNGLRMVVNDSGSVLPRQSISLVLKPGDVLTASVKVKIISGGFSGSYVRFASLLSLPLISTKVINSEWSQYIYQYTATSEVTITTGNAFGFMGFTVGGEYILDEIKLERGNKATDWTPAPEDIDNAIADSETRTENAMQDAIADSETRTEQAIDNAIADSETRTDLVIQGAVGESEDRLNQSIQEVSDAAAKKPVINGQNSQVVTIENALPDSIDGLKLYGKTTQFTTTGAQLANFVDKDAFTVGGITYSCKNGAITAKGTTGDGVYASTSGVLTHNLTGVIGTFCISGNSGGVDVHVRIVKSDDKIVYVSQGAGTFTLDGTEKDVYFYVQVAPNKTVDTVVYPMLNEGTTALPWEPYTGCIPSPNPDYPQELVNLGVSKNLFGGDALADKLVEVGSATKDETAGTVQFTPSNVNGKDLFTNFKANTRYTFFLFGRNLGSNRHMNLEIHYTDGTKSSLAFPTGGVDESCRLITTANKSVATFNGCAQSGSTLLHYDKCGIFEGIIPEAHFKPYGESYINTNATGKNFLDFEACLKHWSAAYTKDGEKYTITAIGHGYNNPFRIFDERTTVSVRGIVKDVSSTNGRVDFGYFSEKGSFVSVGSLRESNPITSNGIMINAVRLNHGTAGTFTVEDIQLEVGDIATTYEPYKPAQTLASQTPNGLPGIPMLDSSFANHIDSDGKTWLCDEIDYGTGEYVQNVYATEVTYDMVGTPGAYGEAGYYRHSINLPMRAAITDRGSMSSHFKRMYSWQVDDEYFYVTDGGRLWLFSNRWPTKDEFIAWLEAQSAAGTPYEVVYQLETPIRTPLSSEELAAFKALGNPAGNVTVYSEADISVELSDTSSTKALTQQIDRVQNAIDQNAVAVENRFALTDELLSKLENTISMLVRDENNESLMTQTADGGWTFSMAQYNDLTSSLSESIDALQNATGSTDASVKILQDAVANLQESAEYVRITTDNDEPCIELGEGDSDFKLKITNTRIMFMNSGSIPTYIDTTGLVTQNITISGEIRHANWIWKQRENGHYSLIRG